MPRRRHVRRHGRRSLAYCGEGLFQPGVVAMVPANGQAPVRRGQGRWEGERDQQQCRRGQHCRPQERTLAPWVETIPPDPAAEPGEAVPPRTPCGQWVG